MSRTYPELAAERETILRWVAAEEEAFGRALDRGSELLARLIAEAKEQETSWVDAADAFKLHDTYGFPYDLTKELLAEQGLSVDDAGFEALMEKQRVRARTGAEPEVRDRHEAVLSFAAEGPASRFVDTEPEAGSDLGALRTVARPVEEDGKVVGYRMNGAKQWISNGGVADVYTVLARAPGGPTWFVVERGAAGSPTASPRTSTASGRATPRPCRWTTCTWTPATTCGLVEGQGLIQAQAVFRLHPPDGGGLRPGRGLVRARPGHPLLDRRASRPAPRSPRSRATPQADRAACLPPGGRAGLHRGDRAPASTPATAALSTEGAIAKYLATEAGNAAADAAIQALGGYGYTREYMVEKIKRDVRITTIYEGTSEIMEMTIARDRWQ